MTELEQEMKTPNVTKDHLAVRLLALHTYMEAHPSGPVSWWFIDSLSEARRAALSTALDVIEIELTTIVEFAEIVELSKGRYPTEALMTASAASGIANEMWAMQAKMGRLHTFADKEAERKGRLEEQRAAGPRLV